MIKYKVIKEYDRYYLTNHPCGYRECFHKIDYKPTIDGYIVVAGELERKIKERTSLPPEKVNRLFNPGKNSINHP